MAAERAIVSNADVENLVHRLYGLRVTDQSRLNSYDDINVYVKLEKEDVSSDGYVLKILNTLDSQKKGFIGAMHAAIEAVCEAGITTSFPVPNVQGEMYSLEKLKCQSGGGDGIFLVRLFHFIPGDVLTGKTYTHQICFQVGQMAGNLDKALKGFEHPGLKNHSRHWNLRETSTLGDKIDSIQDANDRQIVKDVVKAFTSDVINNDNLTKGVIHGDLNEGNIIVKSNCEKQNITYEVCGVLDFGDLVDELIVYEIAIAMAYNMIECGDMDVIDVAGYTLAGYLQAYKLSPADIDVLKVCVSARMAQSFTYGAYEHMKDPSNVYCLNTSNKGWPALRKIWKMSKEELFKRWNSIMIQYDIKTI